MKIIFTILFIIAFSIPKTNAAVGCSTYNGLYPTSNGAINPGTGNVYYQNTDYIAFRTWDNDPNCGIRNNKIKKYKPTTACDIIGGPNWGELVNYDPNDNNCVEVPIDDYVLPAILLISGYAYFRIRSILYKMIDLAHE